MRSSLTLALALLASPVLAQGALPDRSLTASDAASGDQFGASLAVDEPWVVVGAPYDSDLGTNAGAVYVFERQADGSLLEVQQLYASDAFGGFGQGALFGSSVAVHGDRIVVGAPLAADLSYVTGGSVTVRTGAGFVFERVGGTFLEWDRLAPWTTAPLSPPEYFGTSVALDGGQVFLAGPLGYGSLPGSGRIEVFDVNSFPAGFAQSIYPAEYGIFGVGRSLALDGDRLLVGAPSGIGGYGSLPSAPLGGCAVLFERNGSGFWGEVARLASQTPSDEEFVGLRVDVEGDRAVVTSLGALDPVTVSRTSELRVFERDPQGAWAEVALLQAPQTPSGFPATFYGVQLAGDRIYAIRGDGQTSGIVVYERASSGVWTELEQLDLPSAFSSPLVVADGAVIAGASATGPAGGVHEFTDGTLFHGEPILSLAAGGLQELRVRSTEFANGVALLLGSRSGTSPGVVHPPSGLLVPLNFDGYTAIALSGGPVSPIVVALDADGKGDATVTVPAGAAPTLAGTVLHHAALFLGGAPGAITLDAVSNAVALELVP